MLKRQPFIAFRKSSNEEFPFGIYGCNYMNFNNFPNNIIGYADMSFSGEEKMVKVHVPFKSYILIAKILSRIFAYLLIHELLYHLFFFFVLSF